VQASLHSQALANRLGPVRFLGYYQKGPYALSDGRQGTI